MYRRCESEEIAHSLALRRVHGHMPLRRPRREALVDGLALHSIRVAPGLTYAMLCYAMLCYAMLRDGLLLGRFVRWALHRDEHTFGEVLGRVHGPQRRLARALPLAVGIRARVAELEREVERERSVTTLKHTAGGTYAWSRLAPLSLIRQPPGR